MRSPAHLPQLLRQLCSFLQAPGLLRLHTGRLQPLLRLLVITLPSRIMSVPELQRCQSYRGARLLRQLCTIPSAAQKFVKPAQRPPATAPVGSHDNPRLQRHMSWHHLSDSILHLGGWSASAGRDGLFSVVQLLYAFLSSLLSARFTPPGPG